MKILNIVGTRPNFIKISPLISAMKKQGKIDPILLHTGQHYDQNMSQVFFEQLGIPKPDINLKIGSGSNSWQIGEIIKNFAPVLKKVNPEALLVVGDVNSTLACALVSAYNKIPIIHVEAGLRSFDREMPEEINRILTDQVSQFLFTTEKSAVKNLTNEGISLERIHFVGNVMVDSLLKFINIANEKSTILNSINVKEKSFVLLTLHRPSNVDQPGPLKSILNAANTISKEISVVFSIHPRTQKQIKNFGFSSMLNSLQQIPPQPYLDMLQLMKSAKLVITDSGGIQEETTILNSPCLTLRKNTERPITVTQGTSILVGNDQKKILKEAQSILSRGGKNAKIPDLWDGHAAERIVKILCS